MAAAPAVVSPAVADLLHLSARRLGYQQLVRAIGVWGWITAAAGSAQAALYTFYRPVAPAYFVVLSVLALAGLCGYRLANRSSRLAAARFADERLGGGCAYRTVLEIATAGNSQQAAVARLMQWLRGHEPTARHNLQALPRVRWPGAALASALVSMALSLTLVHIPGIAAYRSDPAGSSPAESFAADSGGGIREPTASASRSPSSVPPLRVGGRQPATSGATAAAAALAPGAPEDPEHTGVNMSRDNVADAADRPGGPGLLAGAAHDAELAARLAQTIRFAAIERYQRERPGGEMSGQHAGAAFEPDSGSGPAAGPDDRRGVVDSGRAAVRPSQALEWAPPRPTARVLVSRYLGERDR
ncbi:MAG: hypothetical protein JSR67_11190 [Proteobacteria bacterium]|nr:hypothetical protein [Pseudomonadota bacterium]